MATAKAAPDQIVQCGATDVGAKADRVGIAGRAAQVITTFGPAIFTQCRQNRLSAGAQEV